MRASGRFNARKPRWAFFVAIETTHTAPHPHLGAYGGSVRPPNGILPLRKRRKYDRFPLTLRLASGSLLLLTPPFSLRLSTYRSRKAISWRL
jgi:hypothetical protein